MKKVNFFKRVKVVATAAMTSVALVFSACGDGDDIIDDPDDLYTNADCYLQITDVPSGTTLTTCWLLDDPDDTYDDGTGVIGYFSGNKAGLIEAVEINQIKYWSGGTKWVVLYGSGSGGIAGYVFKISKTSKKFSKGTTTMSWSDFKDYLNIEY
jgi:hypothetical protein